MMGERGMWFKQHFFEWAARVPLIIHAPQKWKPARIEQNVSLVDIMPTMLDAAAGAAFDGYVDPLDGRSLVPALTGDTSKMSDVVISEFAADGSTGPSRMVKKGPWKYMDLEGIDICLYNVSEDPKELNNLAGIGLEIETELEAICHENWDRESLYDIIEQDQKRRLLVHKTTNGSPTYVNIVRHDDADRYIRNAGAADTKARARLPYVAPAKPNW